MPPKKITMENQTGDQETLNPEEETSDLNTEEKEETTEDGGTDETGETESDESIDDLKAKLVKQEELAKNYKIRAEKAERAGKKPKEAPVEPSKPDMSSEDIYLLASAKVHPDDISEVQDYAKLKKITIKESLASAVINTLLREREDERKTAQATNPGGSRRPSKKVPDETMLNKASKGELPDDPVELAEARFRSKKAK